MGQMKELLLHQMEAGYSQLPGEKFVCPGCITDPFLREDLEGELEDRPCSYCGASPSADLLELLDAIAEFVGTEFEDPAHSLPYDGREGGYQGKVYDGYEMVSGLPAWTECDDLVDDVATKFSGSVWSERDYSSLKEDEKLRFGWEGFVNLIKHRTRYLFFDEAAPSDLSDEPIPPSRMLEALGSLIDDFGLFSVLPTGSEIIRARVHNAGASLSGVDDLGPPPREAAILSNRMSPAGVPMFYGALDTTTAFLETFDAQRASGKQVTFGLFSADRDLLLLDLTKLPPFPSPFDRERRELRRRLGFLYEFVDDLSRPIARDGSEHVEYVPTQVVTEFFRHRHRSPEGETLDGILYSSSQDGAGSAVVLFLETAQCGPRPGRRSIDPELVLTYQSCETVDPTTFAVDEPGHSATPLPD